MWKLLLILILVLNLALPAQEDDGDEESTSSDSSEEVVPSKKSHSKSKKSNKKLKKSKKKGKKDKNKKSNKPKKQLNSESEVKTTKISSEPIESGNWIEEETIVHPSELPGYSPNTENVVVPKETTATKTETSISNQTNTNTNTIQNTNTQTQTNTEQKPQLKLTEKVPTFWENFASEYLSVKKLAIAALLIGFFIFYRIKTSGKSKFR